jgi:hypothetical protein
MDKVHQNYYLKRHILIKKILKLVIKLKYIENKLINYNTK